MKKRLVSLLVLAVVLTITPAAMASHCQRCRPLTQSCSAALNYGFEICDYDINGCYVEFACGPHSAPTNALATEYTVASVERLDEPQTNANDALVASLEVKPAATVR